MLVFAVMENNCLEEPGLDWKEIHEFCDNMLLANSREMLEKTCQVRSRSGSFWLGLYRKSGKLFFLSTMTHNKHNSFTRYILPSVTELI